MASKRKTLPKNFEEIAAAGDEKAIMEVFQKCDVNAYGGLFKLNALGFDLPEEIMARLAEAGADVNFRDQYGCTLLHHHAGWLKGKPEILIRLGADVEARDYRKETPLFSAAAAYMPGHVRTLVEAGANVNALNDMGQTPLLHALSRAANANIPNLVEIADFLLERGARLTKKEKKEVERIGRDFEWFRERMEPQTAAELEEALGRLYAAFGVAPIPKIVKHDGNSAIKVRGKRWQEQYEELWEMLVPAAGEAETLQGEAIRLCGRLSHELLDNGGANWDADFRLMAESLPGYLAQGTPLAAGELQEVTQIARGLGRNSCDETIHARLAELTVKWILQNPQPFAFAGAKYKR